MKHWIRLFALIALIAVFGTACRKKEVEIPNPLSGSVWYSDTETWYFFSDGTVQCDTLPERTAGTGTYTVESDRTGRLTYKFESGTMAWSEEQLVIDLDGRESVVLQKNNPRAYSVTDADMMEHLWIGDYENEEKNIIISYSTVKCGVTYELVRDADFYCGVWTAIQSQDTTVRDEYYTVTRRDSSTIYVEVNEAYADDPMRAQFAGLYWKYR